jgi:hypothetical protein
MAHDHHHHHGESARDYFTEQLLTILVCGLFGFVAIQMYRERPDGTRMLQYILAPQFHLPVLIGGIAVLALVVVRAVAVWREAGEVRAHDHAHHHEHAHDHAHHHHDHEHGEHCDHEHEHGHEHHHHHHHPAPAHAHDDHGHSHDLAWVFTRMLILVFPIALFFMGVPNAGYSQERIIKMLGQEDPLAVSVGDVAAKEGLVTRFNDLNDAAYDDAKRESLQGQAARLEGRFRRLGDKEFTLYRLKMTCCAADTVPLKVRIVTPHALGGINDHEWVQVEGQVQFIPVPNTTPTRYIPVIKVADNKDIKKTPPKGEYE